MIFFEMREKHWLMAAKMAVGLSNFMLYKGQDDDGANDMETHIALIIVLSKAAAAGISAVTGKEFTVHQFLDACTQVAVIGEAQLERQRMEEEHNETPIESPPTPKPHVPQTDIGEDDGDDEDSDSDDEDDSEKPEKLLC